MDDRYDRDLIANWHQRAQIDYSDLYMKLYVSYNAWYRRVTGANNEREAITRLKHRFVIWDDYCNGRAMQALRLIAEAIVRHAAEHGGVIIKDADDWRGLIEYWYRIRCDLFHGSIELENRYFAQAVKLAYESLNVYMTEIVRRMNQCFSVDDLIRMREVNILLTAGGGDEERLSSELRDLQGKYINSLTIWNVDMARI